MLSGRHGVMMFSCYLAIIMLLCCQTVSACRVVKRFCMMSLCPAVMTSCCHGVLIGYVDPWDMSRYHMMPNDM